MAPAQAPAPVPSAKHPRGDVPLNEKFDYFTEEDYLDEGYKR